MQSLLSHCTTGEFNSPPNYLRTAAERELARAVAACFSDQHTGADQHFQLVRRVVTTLAFSLAPFGYPW
eukprot:1188262-Prorocentrum_minimum.AAC.2